MIEPNNTYFENDDYEKELSDYLEYDFDGEDVFEDDDINEDFYGADGDETSEATGEKVLIGTDDYINEIDFSQFKGGFKSSLKKVHNTAGKKKRLVKKKKLKPLTKKIPVKKSATICGKRTSQGEARTTQRILVPSNRNVIVEGVDKFILGDDKCGFKNIGYYKCKKLRELVFTMNNNSALDFNLELFNPSEPLDYLYATSGNLNNKIQVAGDIVSYSDVLFNILANPTHIVNAKFTFAGAQYREQINQPLIFKNKRITGDQRLEPLQVQLQIDRMQFADDIVFFDILGNLNRPFIPNGMDVIQYKVLAGNTVTFAFYYEQKDLRKFFFKEAVNSKKLI